MMKSQRPFLVWLGIFYCSWLVIVSIGGQWSTILHHWQIAVAMALGSYVAGSTPMGGGTIGFPVLTLLLDQPSSIGRDFSFMVQSVGMTSASIYIMSARRPLEWSMLRGAMLGTLIGVPTGSIFLVPYVNDLAVKLTFAVLWASFGVMHFARIRSIVAIHGMTPATRRFDRTMGLIVGLLGGSTVTAVSGVGVDMLIYVVLVLVSRADLRIAIPTSVVLMAWSSIVGLITTSLLGRVNEEVVGNWFAAAPIVAVGAPVGAIVVQFVPRAFTLMVVSALCVGQFVWTCVHEQVSATTLTVSILAVLLLNLAFHALYQWGLARGSECAEARGESSPQ